MSEFWVMSLLVEKMKLRKRILDKRMKEHDKTGEGHPLGMMGTKGILDRGVD